MPISRHRQLQVLRRHLPNIAALCFGSLNRTPEFFRRYLSRYLAYADLGSKAALLETEAHAFNDANFVSTWHRQEIIEWE